MLVLDGCCWVSIRMWQKRSERRKRGHLGLSIPPARTKERKMAAKKKVVAKKAKATKATKAKKTKKG